MSVNASRIGKSIQIAFEVIGNYLFKLNPKWNPDPIIIDKLKDAPLSPDGYQNFIFQWDKNFYYERVENVCFTGKKRVLDAGCGLGQWAAALANFNDEVIAVDRNPEMLETSRIICREWNALNVTFEQAELPNLNFHDNSFDLIWCSLVLEYTDRDAIMEKFYHLLKPGGRLYVTTNSRGRWLYKILKGLFQFDIPTIKISYQALLYGHLPHNNPSYLRIKDVAAHCAEHGFTLLGCDSDGCLDFTQHVPPRRRPMFPTRFLLFFETNIEFVAEKPSA